jgi:hypothetical protein
MHAIPIQAPIAVPAPRWWPAFARWRLPPRWTWATLCLLLCAGAACRAQPVAVVVDGGAMGRVFSASGARNLETLELLTAGTRVQIDGVARIVVLYLRSGMEFSFDGPGIIEVGNAQLVALSGNPPVLRAPAPGKEIRLRTHGTAQGGVVLRSIGAPASASAATASREASDTRRPDADAALASWVAYALWLDEIQAFDEAKAIWRRLAAERPTDPALAARAR